MIDRRTLLIGVCGVIAAPVTPATVVPARSTKRVASSVSFTIHGWEPREPGRADPAGQHIVPLYLSNSWRAGWM
jgi:hypothetical protein